MPPVVAILVDAAAVAFTALSGSVLSFAAYSALTAVVTYALPVVLSVGLSFGISALTAQLRKGQGAVGPGQNPGGTAPPPEATQQTQRQPIPARLRHYGQVKVAGPLAFFGVNSATGTLFSLIMLGQGKIINVLEHWLNNEQVTLSGGAFSGTVNEAEYFSQGSPRVQIIVSDGDDGQTANGTMIANFPGQWTADHRLRGVATAMVAFQDVVPDDQTAVYPAGPPNYRIVAQFTRVYDPRDGGQVANNNTTWTWSPNAALVILDYLTHPDGFNRPIAEFNMDSFKAAADICDDAIALVAGGTEPRYRIWHTYDLTERPADVLNRLLAACDGYLNQLNDGTWGLRVGIWEDATVTIADADIISYQLAQGNNALASFNQLTLTFTWSVNDYQTTQAQDWEDAGSIAQFGERTNHLDLPAVPSPGQCRRLGKIAMAKGNPEWIGTITTNPSGLAAFGERNITVNIDELGISQTFFVTDFQIAADLSTCTLSVQSLDASAYDWDPATEEGTVPVTTADIAFGGPPEVPTSWSFSGSLGPGVPGTTFKYIVLSASWDVGIVRDTFTLELNWRREDGSAWNVVLLPPPPVSTGGVWISPLIPPVATATTYEARARWRGPSGMPSDWTATLTTTL